MTVQQLLERRANVWAQMTDLNERTADRVMTAEELAQWDRMEADIRSLTDQIRQKASATELDALMSGASPDLRSRVGDGEGEEEEQADGTAAAYSAAFRSWLREGTNGLEPEQRKALQTGYVPAKELRAQGVGVPAGGGYAVAPEFRARLIERMKAWGAVREAAEVITTETGASLPWPTNDDTGNVGAILAENTQVTEQDIALGTASIDVYMYTSKLVRVSFQLLQDGAIDIEGLLARKFAERLGRATNAHFTTGTGTAQPQGIVTGATVGVTGAAGSTTSITYDKLIDLIHSIDPAYRNERSAFMLNDAALASIRKLRDDSGGAGIGAPIWQPSITLGTPDALLGYGIIVNNDMPVPAANAKSILFGDFEAGYLVRDVLAIQSLRLEERYADFLQVGFLAFQRTGGIVQDAQAFRVYQNSAT